jgi:hypothetical protein
MGAIERVPLVITFEAGFDAQSTGFTTAQIEAFARAGWDQWLDLLPGTRFPSTASFEVEIASESNHPGSNPGGVASIVIGSEDPVSHAFSGRETRLQHELDTGEDINGSLPDATIIVGANLGNTQNSVDGLMAHEFGHALGFNVGDPFGESSAFFGFIDGAVFTGPHAMVNFGGAVPIHQDGCNCHIENRDFAVSNPAASIMGNSNPGSVVTSLDIEILRDIGTIGSSLVGTTGADTIIGGVSHDLITGGLAGKTAGSKGLGRTAVGRWRYGTEWKRFRVGRATTCCTETMARTC